jgi:hypothetical protein
MMGRATLAVASALALVLLLATSAAAATPTISSWIDGIAGNNGWYRGSTHGNNVVLHWSVSADATDSNCLPAITIPGPTPSTGTTASCWAKNAEGEVTATKVIYIDATPPAVTASAVRSPDFNGWYNHPVAVNWSGTDATSGIAGCSSVTYQGPDTAGATVGGGCTDVAGNSASSSVAINYDATPPALANVAVTSTADADVLRWSSSSASDRIVVHRSARGNKTQRTLFDGTASSFSDAKINPGTEYLYVVQAFDQANNASRTVTVAGLPKVLTLRKLPYVPRAAAKPILSWPAERGAAYYNVQLYRGSKRVLAAWPVHSRLGLPGVWRWAGHRHRLSPGRYHWYVWAGFGPRSFARYRTVGSAQFIVPRR